MSKKFPLLDTSDCDALSQSLLFFNMKELVRFCQGLGLPVKGKKIDLIERMLEFIKTGTILQLPQIPKISCAQKGEKSHLSPQAKMLYGSFKNDFKTRVFLKTLIGDHFHYTVFGLDWVQERWLAGRPPTYGEFAIFWQKEYEKRKKTKGAVKQEWALLNFVQDFLKKHPGAQREDVVIAWHQERALRVAIGEKLLRKIL